MSLADQDDPLRPGERRYPAYVEVDGGAFAAIEKAARDPVLRQQVRQHERGDRLRMFNAYVAEAVTEERG